MKTAIVTGYFIHFPNEAIHSFFKFFDGVDLKISVKELNGTTQVLFLGKNAHSRLQECAKFINSRQTEQQSLTVVAAGEN